MASDIETRVAEAFPLTVARHELTVAHEDGLYRHLQFRQPEHSWHHWFDLITVPGALIFQGDYESFVFSRTEDMFSFFRGSAWQGKPNLGYWQEKLTTERNHAKEYSEDLFRSTVTEQFVEAVRDGRMPPGGGVALRADVLDQDIQFENVARDCLDRFEFKGFSFTDTWEWSYRDWRWSFVWACNAIVWGIARYDAARTLVAAAPVGEEPA